MAKWQIKPLKYEATEVWEYSKDDNRVRVTENLKWSSFVCTKDGDGIPEVNTYDIFQTPGEIECGDFDTYSHEVDLDDCDDETSVGWRSCRRKVRI